MILLMEVAIRGLQLKTQQLTEEDRCDSRWDVILSGGIPAGCRQEEGQFGTGRHGNQKQTVSCHISGAKYLLNGFLVLGF